MKASKTSPGVLDHQRDDGWLQITPGERFKIRTSVKETRGVYTMLELMQSNEHTLTNAGHFFLGTSKICSEQPRHVKTTTSRPLPPRMGPFLLARRFSKKFTPSL